MTVTAGLLFDVLFDSRGDATGSEVAGFGLGPGAWYSVGLPTEEDGVALGEEDGVALEEEDGVALKEEDGVALEVVDLFSVAVEERPCTANEPPRSSAQLDEGDLLETLYTWYATLGDGTGLIGGDVFGEGCWS